MNDKLMDLTKKMCMCTYISIFIIILFIMSPLNNFVKTSAIMKVVVLIILGYTLYLSIHQNIFLQKNVNMNPKIVTQVNTNVICSYIFTLFLLVLFFFVVKDLVKKLINQ